MPDIDTIKAWMLRNCHKNIDPETGEIMMTQLAEDAFLSIGDEDPNIEIPEIYFEAAFEIYSKAEGR